ncbi:hypothetical protein PQQ84_24315 [Paraburkholderia strydomiana]|uniref:hypothetical protein n=1 Tax=Paraburkholderia strydomiana TaxID=1245417 RepID=UPI0038BA618C
MFKVSLTLYYSKKSHEREQIMLEARHAVEALEAAICGRHADGRIIVGEPEGEKKKMTDIRRSTLLLGLAVVGLSAPRTAFAKGNRIVCQLTQRTGSYIGHCVLPYDVDAFKIGFDGRSDKLGYRAPQRFRLTAPSS